MFTLYIAYINSQTRYEVTAQAAVHGDGSGTHFTAFQELSGMTTLPSSG